ncbi:DUF2889 domain-containing protein [Streptomyces sp. NBC_00564]|uniref:DUF2889 domain-containing protein n=1 Tax=Streptomyces sp. NBC_00564 TaxID=2903663 RepID=UPI002FCD86F6|nr:DUF2889 domain-containing protein [Streptomyces sp. NBC_00564]
MTTDRRPAHPRHGPHHPTTHTPPRRPGSLRRTSSIDMLRPGGVDGELILSGRARDLLTGPDGRATVVAEAAVHARVDYAGHFALTEIRTTPELPGAQDLLGASVSAGFRSRVGRALPEERERATLTHLLLDDLPGAALVSGYAVGAGNERISKRDTGPYALQQADICSGWRSDGTMLLEIGRTGTMPTVQGPLAPVLEPDDDPWSWHHTGPLPAYGMRRRRRLDLIDGRPLALDVFYRDTHMSPDGVETVIHDYAVDGRIDPATLEILALKAEPRALPWTECPAAAAGAGRLVGRTVDGLRRWVRAELTGTSTCTHLNDALRSVEDVDTLARILANSTSTATAAGTET